MRQKIVAGNWKSNTNVKDGVQLAADVNKLVAEKGDKDVKVILGVPFTHLTKVVETVDKNIGVAAQNIGEEKSGAFTGEVSAEMVKSTGADYVILGHSERRQLYHEDSNSLNKKISLAFENDLIPIYCCGEPLEIREADTHMDYVKKQLEETIFKLSEADFKKLIIAYEPIWAIGTGKTATDEQAQEMIGFIRSIIAEKYNKELSEEISILYGGSAKPSNAGNLFAKKDIDGGLIGGASLKADDFIQIINAY